MEGSAWQSVTNVLGARGQCSRTWPGRSTAVATVHVSERQFCSRILLEQNVSEADGQHVRVTGRQHTCVRGPRGGMASH